MRVRRPWLLVLLLVFFPGNVRADDHTASAYAGAAPIPGSLLIGPHFTFSKPFEHVLDGNLSAIGDLSLSFGTDDDDGKRVIWGGGVGWTFVKGDDRPTLVPAAHFLVVGVTRDDAPGSRTNLGGVLGLELEYLPFRARKQEEGWGVRAQADWVFADDQKAFARFSAGVVYRWHRD
jgi:hypothetical protein